MTRFRHWFIAAAIVCWLAGLTLVSLYFGWFTWAATPQGKATLAGVMFVALATWLTGVAIRDARRRRAAREAQEWDDLDEWERQMYAGMGHWLDHDNLPVRPITRTDMDREDERLTTTVVVPAAGGWPQPQSPRLTDWAVSAAAPAPLPPRYWLGESKPMAEVESLYGAAAWFTNDMRTGVDVAAGMHRAFVDAPVSPAAPPNYHARHDAEDRRPAAHVIGYDRAALRVLNEATGAWPIVRELVGAGA